MSVDALFLSFQTALAGRYSLERELGRGGMGVVYLAREVRLDRPVAIKLLPPELAALDKLRERFLREARTAARLSHPYIVPIHAVDEVDGFVFYVMAYVDGETVGQRVASRGPIPPNDATRILREVAWALAYAHAQGVIHRDIKPANILLERGSGRAMVADFGIARLAQASGDAAGELLGTPEYMSPEQASGDAIDGRSDLYALGVVGFFALTGQLPFSSPTTQGMLAQHITRPAPPVSSVARGVPASLARVVDQCLEKDPAARPATGEALADALAPSLEKRTEIPVPVRVFIDRRRAILMITPPLMVVPMATAMLAELAQHGSPPFYKILTAASAAAIALLMPGFILVARLRTLLRQGYGPADISAALRAVYERKREEFHYEFGAKASLRERVLRIIAFGGIGGGVFLGAAMATGAIRPVAVPIALGAAYFGTIASVWSAKWKRLRDGSGSRLSKLWDGAVGRRFSAIAGFKLGRRAIPANRPTELAIAMSAEALYDSIPKPLREALGDVPAALHALEAHARGARASIDELDATIAQAQHRPSGRTAGDRQEKLVADLQARKTAAEARLSEIVTSLENVRLDLLRLHAGAVSADGITHDLAAARAVSEGAERLLAGVREANEASGRN